MKLSHNKIIVFSEEIAKTELVNCVNAFISSQEIRPRTSIVVCPDKARTFLESTFPVLETNPARYYDLLLASAEYTGYTTKSELIDFYLDSKSDYINPIAIHGNITTYQDPKGPSDPNPPNAANTENESKDSEDNSKITDNSQSTKIIKTGGNNSSKNSSDEQNEENLTPELYGIAVFSNDIMVGTLTNYEVLAHSIMTSSLKTVNFDIDTTTISISQRKSPKISVTLENTTPNINIEVSLDAKLLYSGDDVDYTKYDNKHKLTEKIENEFKEIINMYLEKTAREFKSDIVGFGKILKSQFLTIDELEKINWLEIYQNSKFTLKVNVSLDTAQIFSSSEKSNE